MAFVTYSQMGTHDSGLLTPDQHYYLTKLLDYDYEIVYRLDKDNKVAGALPRLDFRSQLFSIILLLSTFQIIKQIKIENISSPELQGIHTILVQQPTKNLKFKIKDERENFFWGMTRHSKISF